MNRTVSEVMITSPRTLPIDASVGQVRAEFEDSHVHMILLVHEKLLRGTLVRADLSPTLPRSAPALNPATLEGRTVEPDVPIAGVYQQLLDSGQRRLAVVDVDNRLLGLLCLRTDQQGFCTDHGVAARAHDKGVAGQGTPS